MTDTIETTATIDGREYRALVYGARITIVTGPAVLDRLAEIIAHRYPYAVDRHVLLGINLTLAQVTIGVMAEIAAIDGIEIRPEHVTGTEWDDAQHLADQVAQVLDPGWVAGVIGSVYAQHAYRQLPAGKHTQ